MALKRQILYHRRKHFRLWVHSLKYLRAESRLLAVPSPHIPEVNLRYKTESTFLFSESRPAQAFRIWRWPLWDYISHLTFFSLGSDSRRRWKCRTGATDRHAIEPWPPSFTSRQTGRVKSWPSQTRTNAVLVRVTWAPGENAQWMTDIAVYIY